MSASTTVFARPLLLVVDDELSVHRRLEGRYLDDEAPHTLSAQRPS
jgi:hypothetical protein